MSGRRAKSSWRCSAFSRACSYSGSRSERGPRRCQGRARRGPRRLSRARGVVVRRLRVPGRPLAADRRHAHPRAALVLRNAARRGSRATTCLPVRIGELLRAGWLSRDAPMPGGSAFGSVVLDRICDVVTLAVFFAIGLQAVASAAWLVRLASERSLRSSSSPSRSCWRALYTSRGKEWGKATPARPSRAGSSSTRSRCSVSRSAVAVQHRGSG